MTTTITVNKGTRDALRAFKDDTDCGTYNEAIEELLAIATKEGYWTEEEGADGGPRVASVEELSGVEDRVATLEEQVSVLRDAVTELRAMQE